MKLDLKKQDPLYFAVAEPRLMRAPAMNYIAVSGKGAPSDDEYQAAIPILYSTMYGIKMKGKQLPGYQDFVVPPLESLWWAVGDSEWNQNDLSSWRWQCMMRLPDFALGNLEPFNKGCEIVSIPEGVVVQALHVGAYNDNSTRRKVFDFAIKNDSDLEKMGIPRVHEIYLSDPRRMEESRLRSIVMVRIAGDSNMCLWEGDENLKWVT